MVVAARRVSPLIVGPRQGRHLPRERRAGDPRAHDGDLVAVEDDQVAVLTAGGLELLDLEGAPVAPTPLRVEWDVETAELGGHPDFMTKEIYEQPDAIRATLAADATRRAEIVLDELRLSDEELRGSSGS